MYPDKSRALEEDGTQEMHRTDNTRNAKFVTVLLSVTAGRGSAAAHIAEILCLDRIAEIPCLDRMPWRGMCKLAAVLCGMCECKLNAVLSCGELRAGEKVMKAWATGTTTPASNTVGRMLHTRCGAACRTALPLRFNTHSCSRKKCKTPPSARTGWFDPRRPNVSPLHLEHPHKA